MTFHDPGIARQILKTGMVDMFMFSINPAYDYQKGTYGIGEVSERAALYRDCERMGVGISVMKPFAGGQLLDENMSIFKRTLTHIQCFQYALDRPAVMTVLPGVRNMADLQTALKYVSASPEEKDYSVIGEFTPQSAYGICVYCNHCQPCPMGLTKFRRFAVNVWDVIRRTKQMSRCWDALTLSYNLPCDHVIHTVGPIVYGRLNDKLCQDLKNCCENVLQCCLEYDIGSAAFCCISTGEFRFPNDKAAEIAWKTISAFLGKYSDRMERIIFNVFKDSDLELSMRIFISR